MYQKTVAVVTSTIGRPELIRTIESVKAQTYPCKHYIFVDGEQFHDKVREMVKDYPNLIVTYLPMNTGGGGWQNGFVNPAASFLVKEDVICYLDDDNWYDPNHVAEIAHAFNTYPIDMAFNLRRLCDEQGQWIADDNMESLGYWFVSEPLQYNITYKGYTIPVKTHLHRTNGHLDVNCFAFSLQSARKIAFNWTVQKYINDYNVLKGFFDLKLASMCTGKRTVNYIVNFKQFLNIESLVAQLEIPPEDDIPLKIQMVKGIQSCSPQEKPWLTPTIYQNGELFPIRD